MEQLFVKLQKSKFRSSFHLSDRDKKYIEKKGMETIKLYALDFLNKRIKVKPANDGKQTPYKGHPVFTAQHATAICCRKCIEKWHGLSSKKQLNDEELNYLADFMVAWTKQQL